MLNDKNSNHNYVSKNKPIPTTVILLSIIAFVGIAGIAITTSIDSDIAHLKSTELKKVHTNEVKPLDYTIAEKNLERDKLQRKTAVDESVTIDVKNAATMVEKYIYKTKSKW